MVTELKMPKKPCSYSLRVCQRTVLSMSSVLEAHTAHCSNGMLQILFIYQKFCCSGSTLNRYTFRGTNSSICFASLEEQMPS